jgi:protein-S-isoprenylcysteine O-methyltransferase Ste14
MSSILLPLDVWRFLFHSTISEKYIGKRLNAKVRYALIAYCIYVYWILFATIIILNRNLILKCRVDLSSYALYLGVCLTSIGISLAVWATATLGIKVGRRIPEVSSSEKGHIVTKGPYRVVRHPIYLGEFLIILGVFLMSGVITILAQFILKAFFANSVIDWEERN